MCKSSLNFKFIDIYKFIFKKFHIDVNCYNFLEYLNQISRETFYYVFHWSVKLNEWHVLLH